MVIYGCDESESDVGGGKMKIFKIHADYRKNNPHINWYYVPANTKKEARERFKRIVSWLDIYGVELCNEDEARKVIEHPEKYILLLNDWYGRKVME